MSSNEVLGLNRITNKVLKNLCKQHKLYQTPHLNDQLYLHYQGFQAIEGLEEYTGLRCLWLESNAISEIEGLNCQPELRCLYLQNNIIKKIENLEKCKNLDTLNLASNHIKKIENCGVEVLPVLCHLNLSRNYLKSLAGLQGLLECQSLWALDLSHNRIDDILVVKIFANLPELRVLVLQGNPVVSQIPQYRKTLILECKNLTYLDSRPVFPKDRACAEAWKRGGYEEERRESHRWARMERKKIRDSVNSTIRLRQKHGENIQLLESSEDEGENKPPKKLRKIPEVSMNSDFEIAGVKSNEDGEKCLQIEKQSKLGQNNSPVSVPNRPDTSEQSSSSEIELSVYASDSVDSGPSESSDSLDEKDSKISIHIEPPQKSEEDALDEVGIEEGHRGAGIAKLTKSSVLDIFEMDLTGRGFGHGLPNEEELEAGEEPNAGKKLGLCEELDYKKDASYESKNFSDAKYGKNEQNAAREMNRSQSRREMAIQQSEGQYSEEEDSALFNASTSSEDENPVESVEETLALYDEEQIKFCQEDDTTMAVNAAKSTGETFSGENLEGMSLNSQEDCVTISKELPFELEDLLPTDKGTSEDMSSMEEEVFLEESNESTAASFLDGQGLEIVSSKLDYVIPSTRILLEKGDYTKLNPEGALAKDTSGKPPNNLQGEKENTEEAREEYSLLMQDIDEVLSMETEGDTSSTTLDSEEAFKEVLMNQQKFESLLLHDDILNGNDIDESIDKLLTSFSSLKLSEDTSSLSETNSIVNEEDGLKNLTENSNPSSACDREDLMPSVTSQSEDYNDKTVSTSIEEGEPVAPIERKISTSPLNVSLRLEGPPTKFTGMDIQLGQMSKSIQTFVATFPSKEVFEDILTDSGIKPVKPWHTYLPSIDEKVENQAKVTSEEAGILDGNPLEMKVSSIGNEDSASSSSEDYCLPRLSPPRSTIKEVLSSLNERVATIFTMRQTREDILKEKYTNQPSSSSEVSNSITSIQREIDPLTTNRGCSTQTEDQINRKVEELKRQQSEKNPQMIDRVWNQKDQNEDTLEVADGRLMVVKHSTGTLEDLPPLVSSKSAGDNDYDDYGTELSDDEPDDDDDVDEDIEQHASDTKIKKILHLTEVDGNDSETPSFSSTSTLSEMSEGVVAIVDEECHEQHTDSELNIKTTAEVLEHTRKWEEDVRHPDVEQKDHEVIMVMQGFTNETSELQVEVDNDVQSFLGFDETTLEDIALIFESSDGRE